MNASSIAFRLQCSAPTLSAVCDPLGQIDPIVRAARRRLLDQQELDGCWRTSRLSSGIAEAEALCMLAFLNRPNDPRVRGLVNTVLDLRKIDGGWARFSGGPTDPDVSALAYFALRLAGCDADSSALQQCRDRLLAFGRGVSISPRTRFFLALFGQCPYADDWSELLTGSPVEELALQVMNSYKPVHFCPRDPAIAHLLSDQQVRRPSLHWTPIRSWNGRKAAQQLRDDFSEESETEANGPTTVLPLMALHCLRLPESSADVIEAWRQFDSRCRRDGEKLRVTPAVTPQQDTAKSMLTLLECGIPATSREIQKAGAWLWRWLARGQVRGDHPIIDVAWALLALARSGIAFQGDHMILVEHAVDSLLDAQADDGSWGTPESTGLALEALGEFGLDLSDESIADAIAYLEQTQEADGGWRGTTDAHRTYETFRVVSGLRSVKIDLRSATVRRAAAGLKRTRSEFENRPPIQTAWIVLGLLAAGEANDSGVDWGIIRLLEGELAAGDADGSFESMDSILTSMVALVRFQRQRFGVSTSF